MCVYSAVQKSSDSPHFSTFFFASYLKKTVIGAITCPFYLFTFLSLHSVPTPPPRHLLFNSSWFWNVIPGISWASESSVSCSNRLTTSLLPWLCIITDVKKMPVTSRSHSSSTASKPAPKDAPKIFFFFYRIIAQYVAHSGHSMSRW